VLHLGRGQAAVVGQQRGQPVEVAIVEDPAALDPQQILAWWRS